VLDAIYNTMSFEERFADLQGVLVNTIRVQEAENSKLAAENSELTAEVSKLTAKVHEQAAKISKRDDEIKRLDDPYYCCCCKNKETGGRVSFTPCAHVVCGVCIRKVQRVCPLCNVPIRIISTHVQQY
jgi:predicted nuclease with TOPRIM domain